MIPSEMVVVPIVFGAPAAVVVARMWFKHREKMATLARPETTANALEERLERLEHAVDSIAVEMERVGEGQRFVTKLLAERGDSRKP
jgi:hypothetical protein